MNSEDSSVRGCRNVDDYLKLAKIGQGTFGEVFKAKHKTTNQIVALKKVLLSKETEGFPITTLREVKILQCLKHKNIVQLLRVCFSGDGADKNAIRNFYLVFEFCEHDLAGLLSNPKIGFDLCHKKSIMKQLLEGLYHIHFCKVLHRDLKPSNILITRHGVLKLADFGLCKHLPILPQQPLTNKVVTLWYRPPEILLGSKHYTSEIDMWGVGCIMAELWTRSAIMPGHSEQQQLCYISQLCGSITPESFPGVEQLELYNKIELPKSQQRRVIVRLKNLIKDKSAIHLIDQLLQLDSKKRIDAKEAINHDFIWSDPQPGGLDTLLSKVNQCMFELLSQKRKAEAEMMNAPKHMCTSKEYQERVY